MVKARIIGEMKFDNGENVPDLDDVLSFDYFLAVHKLVVEFAMKLIMEMTHELKGKRREALENYEDDLFEDLLLQEVLLEDKAVYVIRNFLFPVLDLRTRDLVKAKVKYLLDPALNSQFE